MKIICQECNVVISKQVIELNDSSVLNKKSGEDYIPEGFFTFENGEADVGTNDTIIINKKDLINSNYHPNKERLHGCCGYDGIDGINRVCVNIHEIGTEKSDCWMPHFIALEPHLVKIVS